MYLLSYVYKFKLIWKEEYLFCLFYNVVIWNRYIVLMKIEKLFYVKISYLIVFLN